MISLHHSRMSVGAPVIFQRGSIQTQSTHTDRAERERAFALLLATLSPCLHEPQSRCLKILKANAAYLSRVERYRNQPQGRAQLQKHVARFEFAQQTELSRLDAEDQRPRLVASIHAGDFIYGTNVFANYESPDTRQYVLLQKAPGEIFQRNLSQAFGEKRYSSRTQLLLESFDFAQFRRRLNSSKSSLLTFTDLPPGFATLNISVGHLLGVPTDLRGSVPALAMIYVGFFLSGFFAGMGLLSIISVIALHLRFAPHIQYSLNPDNPDGSGGIGSLGDSLWFFASLIGAVGVLVSVFLVNVEWSYLYKGYGQVLFMLWLGLPYTLAVSIVLVPGLAVRRQVRGYKSFREKQLKEEARLFNSFKEFKEAPDEEIIATKRAINERLENIQTQMEKLRKMRNSHIDNKS